MPRVVAMLELVRIYNCLLAGVAVLIGAIVTLGGCGLPSWIALPAFLAAMFVAAGGNAINDYFDRKIDKVNRPQRPIPSGRIRERDALVAAQILFILGILLAVRINPYCVLLAALNSLVLAFYAWGIKRRGLAGNIAIGYLVGSTFLFGGLAIGDLSLYKLEIIGTLAAMAALSTVGRELIKDIEDMRGDRKPGFKTFPLCHGSRGAAALAVAFIAAAVLISPLPYMFLGFGRVYLVIVMLSVAAFAAAAVIILRGQKVKAARRASFTCKIAMGLGLLAFLAGALLHA